MIPPIRIILADDHTLLRDALAAWLNTQPDLRVVATCGDAAGALSAVRQHQPDVLLLDIDMPGQPAFDAAQALRVQQPNTRVVFLSAYVSDFFIGQALAAKAAGYLTKGDPPELIAAAIRDVQAGDICFSSEIRSRIIIDHSGARLATAKARPGIAELTPRELEVLRHLAAALSRKAIARAMHLSVHTVDRHTTNLMKKLAIHSRAELCRFALDEGLARI